MVEERVQRRLAAILAADVVGYSRLMGEDEEATLATLKSFRSVIDELIRSHDGRVAEYRGSARAIGQAPERAACPQRKRAAPVGAALDAFARGAA